MGFLVGIIVKSSLKDGLCNCVLDYEAIVQMMVVFDSKNIFTFCLQV